MRTVQVLRVGLVMLWAMAWGAPRCLAGTPSLADRRSLEAFCDGFIESELRSSHVPGAAVAVVQDGQVLLAKGYGYADAARRTPVSAERTMFHVGSVSKLLTWTAVMQLVEQGKLDLGADVNGYLSTPLVAAGYPEPVTMADLMSHSAGFEDRLTGVFANDPAHIPTLRRALAGRLPARVRPPGELCAYSNHGAALAGLVVEEVSGEPFERYIERHLLAPLGMSHSSFAEPLPADLARWEARGYRKGGEPAPPEYISLRPAGSLSASAGDMARFMIAHLEEGRLGQSRILRPATARLMHGRLFTPHPGVNGWAHGFMELSLNGRPAIHHGGDTLYFHSELLLLPRERVGLFVTFNGAEAEAAPARFLATFGDRYYPAATRQPRGRGDVRRYAGSYLTTRRSYTSVTKIAGLFDQVQFRAVNRTTLAAELPRRGPLQWVEVRPLALEPADGRMTAVGGLRFTTDKQGRVSRCFLVNNASLALERAAWYDTPPLNLGFLAGSAGLLLTAAVGWPVAALVRRRRREPKAPDARPRVAGWLAWGSSMLYLGGLAAATLTLANPAALLEGIPPLLAAGLAMNALAALLAAAAAVMAVAAWRRRWWGLPARLYYTLAAANGPLLAVWLYHWGLLGGRLY